MKNFIKKRLSLVVFAALLLSFVPIYAIQARAAQTFETWEDAEGVKNATFTPKQSALNNGDKYTLYDKNGTSSEITIDKSKQLGTMQNPIGISTEAELILFGQQTSGTSGKYYILDKPDGVYDMQGDKRSMLPLFKMPAAAVTQDYEPNNPFGGTLIGGGATIKNANIGSYTNESYNIGLFGHVTGVVSGITLEGCTLYCDSNASSFGRYAGSLVAYIDSGALINCGETDSTFTNIEPEATHFGGLVGAASGGKILNCYATSEVRSSKNSASVGGLVGCVITASDSVTNCYAVGDVTGNSASVGGLVGSSSGTVQNCYAAGDAAGGNNASVGGLVGGNWGGTVQNCYAAGDATGGDSAKVGGLVGNVGSATVQYCYAAGDAAGGNNASVGGLVGNVGSATVQNCYAAGTASGGSGANVDDVAGSGTATNSYGKADCSFESDQTFKYSQGGGTTYANTPGGTTLLDTLNAWVADQAGKNYEAWDRKDGFNGNYPFLKSLMVPQAPGGLTASPDNGQVTLSWTTPISSGSAITGYELSHGATSGYTEDWQAISDSDSSMISHTVTGLSNGTEYTFEIRAVNAAGEGAASEEAKATPAAPPSAPVGLTVTPGDGQVALSWTTPDNGGSAITGYELSHGATSGYTEDWQAIAASNSSMVSHTVTGLINGTEYTFEIRAVNAAGDGASSGEAKATPAAPYIPPPYDPSTPTPTINTGNNKLTTPEGQDPIVDKDGNATLPGGGTLETPEGCVIDLPPGTTIDKDANVTIPENDTAKLELPGGA